MNRFLSADWEELTHAYGSAEDVPGLLAALKSEDATTCKEAFSELFDCICHQGSVYPATVKAVPELVAYFNSPDCKDREGVAVLLASIASGDGYYTARYPDYRRETELTWKGTPVMAEIEEENETLRFIGEMAVQFLPLVEHYMEASNPMVREIIAKAMLRHIEALPHYEQFMRARLELEEDGGVRETIIDGLSEYFKKKTIPAIREHYVERFIEETTRLRSERSGKVYTEAALRTSNGKIAREGPFRLGMRVDAAIPDTGERARIDSISILPFQPITIRQGKLNVELHPFQWDWCVVTLECEPGKFHFESIVEWFERWFDADDEFVPDEQGNWGAVHFLDEPRTSNRRISITADLGTAMTDAFYELLEACARCHPKNVWVSNKPVVERPA